MPEVRRDWRVKKAIPDPRGQREIKAMPLFTRISRLPSWLRSKGRKATRATQEPRGQPERMELKAQLVTQGLKDQLDQKARLETLE